MSNRAISKDSQVKAAKHLGNKGETEYRVANSPGLILVVGQPKRDGTSSKVWKFVATRTLGRRRQKFRERLGTYPTLSLKAARDLAEQSSVAVKQGVAPCLVSNGGTFADFVADYLDDHRHLQNILEYERELRKDALPALGHRKPREITPGDVDSVGTAVLERGSKTMAHRIVGHIKAIYNYALFDRLALAEKYGISSNPADKLGRQRRGRPSRYGRNPPRDRTLDDGEIVTWWQAVDCSRVTRATQLALKLILATAQRPGEVRKTTRSQLVLDCAEPLWRLPKTKNGRPHLVPLSPMAAALFQEALYLSPSKQLVFPSPNHSNTPISRYVLEKVQQRIFAKLAGIRPATPHDLRRTAATGMAAIGVPNDIIKLVLNHTPMDVTRRVYNLHDFASEKREAMDLWSKKLEQLLDLKCL